MAIPTHKEELKQAIRTNYEKLVAELISIPSEYTSEKELEGHAKGTHMSVNDLVAYLLGWGGLVLKWNRKKDKGEPVDLPETGYKWNELGTLAQKFYADHKKKSYKTLLMEFEKTVMEILALVDSKTEKQLYGAAWYENYTLGRMIQLNTSSPYANARLRIRKWKKARGLK